MYFLYFRYKANNALLTKAVQFQQTLTALKEKSKFIIDKDLTKADRDLHNNIKELQIIDFKMQVLLNLQNILKLIDSFNNELRLCHYVNCVNIIRDLMEIFQAIPADERLDVFDELKLTIRDMELL